MERLPGLLAGEPVYWIERVTALPDGRLRTEIGFSDVAAHPYEALVDGTVTLLRGAPGVDSVIHEDREAVLVVSRGVNPQLLWMLVDQYWFEHLPSTPIAPGYETDPSEVLASPWPSAPPLPRGANPVPAPEADRPTFRELRAALALPPSRRRMWTYLVCGAVPFVGGVLLVATHGGANGVIPLVGGALNLAVGVRIAVSRASLAGARDG